MCLWYSIKGGDFLTMSTKLGRPKIDNPKNHDIKVRVDNNLYNKLLSYCSLNNLTKAEVIRIALIDFLKKK